MCFSAKILKLIVDWVQDVIWLLSALALPRLLYEDHSSSVDKHMPAAASAAGGPFMQHTCNNTFCFRFSGGSIIFSRKLILWAFGELLIPLWEGLK